MAGPAPDPWILRVYEAGHGQTTKKPEIGRLEAVYVP